MKKAAIICLFVLGCGDSEEVQINEPSCRMVKVRRAAKTPIVLKIWLDQEKRMTDSFVLNSLNRYWSEVSVEIVRAESPEEANIGLVYVKGVCKNPVRAGYLKIPVWENLLSIQVDIECFHKIPDYEKKFPAAASNALGMIFGIEPYPSFCGNGIMAESVGAMVSETPEHLSEGDKEAFYRRTEFSSSWEWTTECYQEPEWEKGTYVSADNRSVKFWADSTFSAIPIEDHLNRYFKVFGRKFEAISKKEDGEFTIEAWDKEYSACSPLAIAFSSIGEIRVKASCLESSLDSERDATIIAHEVAHLFGVSHVPDWCGNSLMNPFINPGPYFTPIDVLAWDARSPVESLK